MATVETIYLGGLRTEATHVQSGTKILTDAPTDNHGKGEAFSPTDLVATALGSCMMTIMGIAAQTHGIDIDGTKLHITKIMSASPRQIGEIVVEVHFPKPIADPKQREILERCHSRCEPVRRTFESSSKWLGDGILRQQGLFAWRHHPALQIRRTAGDNGFANVGSR